MDQNQFVLKNKQSQELLESIFQDILNIVLREEEDIQNELDPILENLDFEVKLTTLMYIRKQFPNFQFWKAEKYQIEESEQIQEQQSVIDYLIIYKEFQNDKIELTNFINFLKNNKDFVIILQKLKGQFFSLFELNELIFSQRQYSKDVIKYLLQFLYVKNDLSEIEQNSLEQTIGNLLSPKVFEFTEFTESILKENILYVSQVIQNVQLQNKNYEDSVQDEKLNEKQQQFLRFICLQNIRDSKNNLNKNLCDLLQMKIEQFSDEDTIHQILQNKIDSLALKDLSQYEVCYFHILFYFWIQYFNKLNLKSEIKLLEEDLKKVKLDRKQATIKRYLNKFKKLSNDEVHTFIIHQLIYFDPALCIDKEKQNLFKAKSDDHVKIAQQDVYQRTKNVLECSQEDFNVTLLKIQNLSITNFLQLIQSNSESFFFHFLFLLKKIDNQKHYSLLSNLFIEQKLRQIQQVLQSLEKCSTFLKLNEIIFLLNLIGRQHQIEENKLQKCRISYYIFQNFNLPEQIEKIESIKIDKQNINEITQLLNILENISQRKLKAIKLLVGNEKLKLICSDLLDIYLESQHEEEQLFKVLSKLIQIVNSQKTSNLRIFQIMLKILRPKYKKKKKSDLRIKLRNINQRLLKSILQCNRNKYQIPNLKIFIDTLYILFSLLLKCDKKQQEYLMTNLNQIILNKCYDFALIRQEFNNKTPFEKILKLLLIQFIYLNQQNSQNFVENLEDNQSLKLDKLCENLHELDPQLYQRWLGSKNYYDQFRLTPFYFSKYKQYQKIPKETDINLYDFNISLLEMKNEDQIKLIRDWVQNMNDSKQFKQLIPFFFNIIKRGDDPKKFIQLINKELEQSQEFKNGLNMKALFQIFYNNSDQELQVMLLKLQSKNFPVPLIFQNQDLSNLKSQEEIYQLNEKLFYVFPECLPIINISFSENETTIGKTELINKIFYQMDKFETLDMCELNRNTIDIMFDFSFSGSRQLCVADAHGYIPIEILRKLIPLFKIWIVQIDSESQLLNTFSKLQQLFHNCQQVQIPEICLVIRNSTETAENLAQNSKYSEIFKSIKYVHCIIDLTKKNISKTYLDTAIEKFQNFIYDVIQKMQDKKQTINQKSYLNVIKGFNASDKSLSEQIENYGKIMAELEVELNNQIKTPNGFYDINSFPLRSIDWQIKNLKEELNQLMSLKGDTNKDQIQKINKKISKLEDNIDNLKPTKLLNLFCDLFQLKNSYILYLSFTDKIRQFNEQNTYQIQNQIQHLNESIQKIKKERSSLKQNNEQLNADAGKMEIFQKRDQMKTLNEELVKNMKDMQLRNIGIELFWRELISMKQKYIKELNIKPVDVIYEMIKKGEPFEFLDGDQLKINQVFLKELTGKFSQTGEEKVLVLSVLGPQSSGKSTILNKIFGCHFWTSVGRCTKGIYLQLLRIQQKEYFDNLFDYILILDSEGLQNPNQVDPEFDKKIALFILSISDIILINVKGDIHQQFKNLVEMCIFKLGQLQKAISSIKQLSWCFNQNNDVNNFAPFLQQIQGIANNLNKEFNKTDIDSVNQSDKDNTKLQINSDNKNQENKVQNDQENENQIIDYNEILDIKKENIQILGFASTEKSWKNQALGITNNWRQLIVNETFSEEAYQYGVRIIKNFIKKKKSDSNMPSLHSFIQSIDQNWQTICRLPDLLEFTQLIQCKQDAQMKKLLDQIYEQQDFSFKDYIQSDIRKYFDKQKYKNMQMFQDQQTEKEKEIVGKFETIKERIIEDLLQVKKEHQISKKIFIKYQNRIIQQISTEVEDCKMLIFNEIKNLETIFQQNNGFLQIYNFISVISEDTAGLKKLQGNPKLIQENFNKIWKDITFKQEKQMTDIFYEFSEKQYKSISESFTKFKLTSKKEKDYQNFFIENINKNSPFGNQQVEKEQIMEIFKFELQQQQFQVLDGTKNVNVYGDIFGQPIVDRLNRASDQDILNIKDYYQIELTCFFISKQDLISYLKNEFLEDFMYQFNSFKTENKQQDKKQKNHYGILSQFFIIFQQFNIQYNQQCYSDLLKCIQEIPGFFGNIYKSHEDRVVQALTKLISTLTVNQEKIVCTDVNFFQNFQHNYYNLYNLVNHLKIKIKDLQECDHYLYSQNNMIIIHYFQKVIPIEKDNHSLKYIADQKDLSNKQYFIKQCLDYLSKEMFEKNAWNKLYFELYDIILMKMRSNQNKSQIINKGQQQDDSDEEISQSNINLILMIMSEIKLKINLYNKQFAKFGVILNMIGERCIYYYSMFLIWRFSCYNKWNILNKNQNRLEGLRSEQYEKYKAAIQQNKVEQSVIKANLFAKLIYQTIIQQYYQKNQQIVKNFIEAKNKKCIDIIKEQDILLLENYQTNSTKEQKDKIISYITDQKKFINELVNQSILDIKNEIIKEHQEKLIKELQNYLYVLQKNINLISTQLETQYKEGLKTIDYFERKEQDKIQDVEYEKEMFKIVQASIFVEKKQKKDFKEIKGNYQEYFYNAKFQELPSQIIVTMLQPSDSEIQTLKPYISQLLKQITSFLDECKKEKFNIGNFNIKEVLDKIKNNMNGCQESCPLCKRKCDQPNDKCDQSNEYNHKHQCQNGHQLRGMNFVLIDDKPSLFTCEEITDEMTITTQETSKVRTWKEIKLMYKQWDFKTLINNNDNKHQKQVKDKMMNVWNGGIGQLICNILSEKYKKSITYITKHNFDKYEQDRQKVHYIFMLDDSRSMSGQAWINEKNGAIACMEDIEKNPNARVSVIIFNSNARVAIDCEKVNIQSQYDRITFEGGGTNFENAFQSVFDQIQRYQNQKFERNLILFYTDGGDQYPQQAMNKFIQLPQENKKTIQLIACSEENNPSTLSLMVTKLKESGYLADLKTNIKNGAVLNIWSEIVLKGVHVSD